MSTTLRQELRDMISGLHAHLQEDNSENIEIHHNRCQMAEISVVRLLTTFVHQALLSENQIDQDSSFMDAGQVRDCNDYVSIAIKDLKNYKKKTEQALEDIRSRLFPGDLNMSKIDPSTSDVFKKILHQETSCTQQVEESENKHAATIRKSIGSCSDSLCKILVEALEKSAEENDLENKQKIGKEAAAQNDSIVKEWLDWYVRNEPKTSSTPSIILPHAALLLTSANDDVGQFIKSFRKLMHINRQYARLISLSSRVDACVTVVNLLNSLKARIILPNRNN